LQTRMRHDVHPRIVATPFRLPPPRRRTTTSSPDPICSQLQEKVQQGFVCSRPPARTTTALPLEKATSPNPLHLIQKDFMYDSLRTGLSPLTNPPPSPNHHCRHPTFNSFPFHCYHSGLLLDEEGRASLSVTGLPFITTDSMLLGIDRTSGRFLSPSFPFFFPLGKFPPLIKIVSTVAVLSGRCGLFSFSQQLGARRPFRSFCVLFPKQFECGGFFFRADFSRTLFPNSQVPIKIVQ